MQSVRPHRITVYWKMLCHTIYYMRYIPRECEMLDDKKWQLVNELVRGGHVPGPAGREGYTDLRTDYSFDPGELSGQGQSQSVFKETDQLELPLLAMTTFPV